MLKHWKREAKDGVASVIQAKKERYKAKQEARAAQLVATIVGDAKVRVEVDLTKALNSLAAAEEGGRKSKAEITRLETEFARIKAEQTLLLLEL